jgi:hypothetical protein
MEKSILVPLMERSFNLQETLKVLTNNLMIYFSWGVSQKINVDNKGLLLKVNGHFHKSYVFITLSHLDLYDVHIISSHGNILDQYKGIYFDQLVEVIDNRIEKIPDYKF